MKAKRTSLAELQICIVKKAIMPRHFDVTMRREIFIVNWGISGEKHTGWKPLEKRMLPLAITIERWKCYSGRWIYTYRLKIFPDRLQH